MKSLLAVDLKRQKPFIRSVISYLVCLFIYVKGLSLVIVRERVEAIMDNDSEFFEIGALAGWEMDYGTVPSATTLLGIGKVHGIPVLFSGSDA